MIVKKAYTKNNNEITLHKYDGETNNICLVIGVVHGEEPQGKFLIEKYLEYLEQNNPKLKNTMLFIQCLNPDGMSENKRQNANGVDLNRNFPTKNWGEDCKRENKEDYFGGKKPASETETNFVLDTMREYPPDFILTIHAPYKVVNYDGPALDTAKKISEIMGYPVCSDIGYPTPGSFGTYAGVERNIPIITLELEEEKTSEEYIKPMFSVFDLLSTISFPRKE